jgi:hypothetical protein
MYRSFIERKKPAHRDDQRVVGHLPCGIDHRAYAVGDDQELVCLNRLAFRTVDQVVEHQADVFDVFGILVEFDGHGCGKRMMRPSLHPEVSFRGGANHHDR